MSTVATPPLGVSTPSNEVNNAFDVFNESLPTSSEPDTKRKYRAIVVESHSQVRNMLVECLRFSGFDAEGYAEGELALRAISQGASRSAVPDLFVIDLELQAGEVGGMNLIERLTDTNVPSSIMAMSQSLSGSYLIEAMKVGAADVVHKPFDVFQIIQRMEHLADIGRKRRLYQLDRTSDDSRRNRPVFLSYSHNDRRIASVLRCHIEACGIGVWYAADNLQPGDHFRRLILDAIDHASVFVPLITDSYPTSPYCMAELVRFYRRVRNDQSPLLLPVLYGSPDEIENFYWIKPIIEEHHYADITSDQFVEGLTALLGRIQQAVSERDER